ncbi:MAG: LysM peptidoglycan-binding domain-containing protein [Chloroflexota bacterium]
MARIIRSLSALVIFALTVSACTLGQSQNQNTAALAATQTAATVELAVVADTSVPFTQVGQTVEYRYRVRNTGTAPLGGVIAFTGASPACPNVNTVGNNDDLLDPGEEVICESSYAITQADLDRGFIETTVTANVNGTLSNPVTTTVQTVPAKLLTLTKTADPTTYDRAGQTITYTYTIKNSGSQSLGPAQFTISDPGLSAGVPFNCGDANATLIPGATVSCTGAYITTQADMTLASITTSATASGGGAGPSAPASATVTRAAGGTITATPSANLTKGATIQHTVIAGEWLWQIARCYGASPTAVVAANPQLANPAQISPGMVITVPSIGSNGTIYGPPCVVTHTVVTGDTWASIAQKYNADPVLLQMVNPGPLTVGSVIVVPRNSAGATAGLTPIATSATVAAPDAIRINFAAGATTTTVTGTAPAGVTPVRYLVNAGQGQVMTVKLTAAANSANVAIYAPNGSALKQADLNPTWSGTLPAAGDYRIEVTNALGSGAPPVTFTLEVSLTGACMDMTRSLKLETPAAAPTHFNICGTLDAATGKTKVTTIYVYQRPEDVAVGAVTQTIAIPIEVWTPLDDPNALIAEDLNADGYTDFRIMNSPAGGTTTYLYYLYNPSTKQFIFSGMR